MMNWFDILENTGIVPVVTAEDPSVSGPLASALISGGLGAAEITFRTPAAASVIAGLREVEPGLL
ncbi:MAG: 2-dehydro-3-deoxyphosphogluconate aldolase, partial [Clostridia bacterium]|nr:2-dehydro-3-deoxyphosphogluconate aldolase [Clostridia bacterium]